MKLRYFLLVAVACSTPVRGDWQWDNDLAPAGIRNHEYEAHFSFKNNGNVALTVTGLTSACHCMRYRFESASAKPGKMGGLTIYLVPNADGPAEKEMNFIVSGPASATSRELTVRFETSNASR